MSQEQKQNTFDHVKAITSISEDELNRAEMAKSIATLLLNDTSCESAIANCEL